MDSLYFLHIPKTAGYSLRHWFIDLFAVDDFLDCIFPEELRRIPREEIEKYHFFSGHFGFELYNYLSKTPSTITWLRDPISREISQYNFLRLQKHKLPKRLHPQTLEYLKAVDELSIDKLCQSKLHLGSYDNLQVRHLASTNFENIQRVTSSSSTRNFDNSSKNETPEVRLWTCGKVQECTDTMLECAKQNLSALLHFGLFELMEQSIDLMCHYLYLPPRPLSLRFNATANLSNSISNLPSDVIELIREVNKYDCALYEFALAEFKQRYQIVKEQYSNNEYTSSQLSFSINELNLANTLEKRFLKQRRTEKLKSIDFNFSVGAFLRGWYPREYYKPLQQWLRWAGPESCSSVYVPLEAGIDYCITFKVLFHLKYETIKSLKLQVKNTTISLTTFPIQEENSQPSYLFTGIIPSELIDPDAYYTEISFFVDQVSLLELPDQTRYVSFATDGLQIRPLTLNDLLKNEIIETLPKPLIDRILVHSSQLDALHEKQEQLHLKFADYSLLKGWYQREYYEPLQAWIRWLGPETSASVYVSLRPGISYQITFDILFCMADDILESLRLQVNGETILLREIAAYFKTIKRKLVGIIPSTLIRENTNYTEIAFYVNRTIAMELPNQTRYVSFATDGMMIEPCKNAKYESCDP